MYNSGSSIRRLPVSVMLLVLLGLTACQSDNDKDKTADPDPESIQKSDPISRFAILSGIQQIVPIETAAVGNGEIKVDPDTRELSGSLTFTGMTATAAHIHSGVTGTAGPVVVSLTVDATNQNAVVPAGTILTQQQYDDLLAGAMYFNIHSSNHATGEIRGQIGRVVMRVSLDGDQVPTPVTTAATGGGLLEVDPETLTISGTINFSDMTATNAHIHSGSVGVSGGVVTLLTVDGGALTASVPEATQLTVEQYADLLAGKLYVNLHSAANIGGEIRGQIGPVAMTASLDGAQEVPEVATSASGQAVFLIDPVTRGVSGGVSYAGVSATAAHIHSGAVGANGGPVVALTVDANTNTAVVPGGTVLTQEQYDAVLSGGTYVNVHSTTYAGGEIRGQLGVN